MVWEVLPMLTAVLSAQELMIDLVAAKGNRFSRQRHTCQRNLWLNSFKKGVEASGFGRT